ncbi:MAG: SDR family oxidoreductase [Gammaproteobacteria bacterium]|nr:SDR family oxidoreductase [Gammaproteobacteria bacterium]
MDILDQTAVVTGGNSGMGKATVQALTQRGIRVMVWDKNIESGQEHAVACDVSSEQEVEQALQKTIDVIGVPRILVNCAGIAPARRMVNKKGVMPLADFKHVIDTNLVGSFNVMRVVVAAMSQIDPMGDAQERGVIINTASVAAFEGQIGQTAYAASKGGVVAMTLPAARELSGVGIRVNTIAPGLIATPMLLGMPQEVQDSLVATTIFPKRLGRPEEYASLVVHLVENTMINGEVIRLDGAVRMQPT